MSQEKIDKYKEEQRKRKDQNTPKQSKVKSYLAGGALIILLATFIIYFGYSVAIETGLYTPEPSTTAYVGTLTAEELESSLQNNDPLGYYKKNEDTTTEGATEQSTDNGDTTEEVTE